MAFDGRVLAGVGVLAAVVEGGSFVRAATLLGLTASGVSRAIGRLEARLHVRLLDRTTRAITLTDEGRRFYEEVRPHLAAMEEAAAAVSGSGGVVRGRLRVDVDPFFLPLVLAGRLGIFCDRHPDLAIEFVSSERLGDLVSDGIDLAIRFGEPRHTALVSRKLIEAPILTVAAPAYLARFGAPAHPSELSTHRCLQFVDPHSGRPYPWEFVKGRQKLPVETRGPLTFTNPQALLEECLAGTGVAQVIGWGVGQLLKEGRLVDLFPAWHGERFPLYALHPSKKHVPAKVRAFIDFCTEIAATL
ncbi:transcriptional regulator, LysR family [Ancylobacter novellus DSM 506]|uniref:Transcriptional regulator, LysR family n=1 Tax=Ancylobacter novellus (strain ATCC 8093 / DSM 506 / JCM 20403 / CCM 1077 / IAM 12100 / NBRC 12443 / NCIMB 10456) TaxID=639283 RepID=D7AAY3_ANCN5|nr:LysR family transcriptional regulator [Ancylobacter novellus]ADH91000.1 transcriptional regulator, LysR family [Ancylobacter novellus DSM 506]